MNTRGVDFMHEWADVNFTNGWRSASREFVTALFRQCLAAVAGQGITMDEIEGELGSDIRTIIFEAFMNDPNDEFEALAPRKCRTSSPVFQSALRRSGALGRVCIFLRSGTYQGCDCQVQT